MPLKSTAGDFHLRFIREDFKSQGTEKSNNDSMRLDLLKFYVAEIRLFFSNSMYTVDSSAHLIDLSESSTTDLVIDYPGKQKPDSLQIHFGTDSIMNSSGALGGDLDPILGMYWTWQSGYVNYKLEGVFSSIPFEFHLGGYQTPFQTDRKVTFEVRSSHAVMSVDVKKFLADAYQNSIHKVMAPGQKASALSDAFISCIHLQIK
ncbi:MAG: MbnP family protein [Bacteroidota bacterium]